MQAKVHLRTLQCGHRENGAEAQRERVPRRCGAESVRAWCTAERCCAAVCCAGGARPGVPIECPHVRRGGTRDGAVSSLRRLRAESRVTVTSVGVCSLVEVSRRDRHVELFRGSFFRVVFRNSYTARRGAPSARADCRGAGVPGGDPAPATRLRTRTPGAPRTQVPYRSNLGPTILTI